MRLFPAIPLLIVACSSAAKPSVAPIAPAQALVTAARAGDSAKVAFLLSDGVSPDTLAADGTRPLTEAARHGRVVVARLLLAADARMDLADSSGLNAWDYAIQFDRDTVAALLTWQSAQLAGASPEANQWFAAVAADSHTLPEWHRLFDGELESLALLYATVYHRPEIVSRMRHGAGIPNRTGVTPLLMAARFGLADEVRDLLQAGANADLAVKNHWQSTPLMEAARDGHVEIGVMLLTAGARIDHRDAAGGTALHWAVRSGETAFARMLLDHRADPEIAETSGARPLEVAKQINHGDLIALLEARSAKR